MFLVMTTSDSLLAFVAWARLRDVPRVGWPVSFLPPPGVHVRATERNSTLNVFVTSDDSDVECLARLDLETREVVASPAGAAHRRLRRLALRFVADRNAYDRRCGLDTTPPPPDFTLTDDATWSDMQLLAIVTKGLWYPPDPDLEDARTRLHSIALATRFNRYAAALRQEREYPPTVSG